MKSARSLPRLITIQTYSDVVQEYAHKALLKDPGSIAAFVELHIEQGPHLEAEKKDIGIVEAIMAPALLRVEFTGRGGHGGETICALYFLLPLQGRPIAV